MTYAQSAQQALNTKIFVINGHKMEVEETTLYDHVVESAEETTSPRGVMTKLFVQENEEESTWEVRQWEPNGRSRVVDSYSTEEEARDEWYIRTYNYDFMPDDQRDTRYWANKEEADSALQEMIKEQ